MRADEPIDTIRVRVEQNGLTGFREAVAANGWVASSVPSLWHLANVEGAGAGGSGQAARAQGTALLGAVDAWVPSMQSESGAALTDRVARLIDLAQWAGAAEGYGNFFVASRACDVALSGLARQAMDTDIPAPEVVARLARCRLAINSPASRARILNDEAGGAVFPSAVDSNEDLENLWSARATRLDLADADDVDPAVIEYIKKRIASLGLDPNTPEPFASFLVDESCPPPATTRSCWEKKLHHRLVVGMGPLQQKLHSLEELLVFRAAIGSFPTQPQGTSIVLSPLEIAFDEAWASHETPATEGLGPRAASTYESILAGRFIDEDSRELSFHAPTPVGSTPSSWPATEPTTSDSKTVAALLNAAATATSCEAQQAALDRIEELGCAAVRELAAFAGDKRKLPCARIRLRNKSAKALEGLRHYSPRLVGDAAQSLLNQLTGQHFGDVYNGSTEQELESSAKQWQVYVSKTGASDLCPAHAAP